MMKPHIKNYVKVFGLDNHVCSVCGAVAVDIHHIEPKGMGGSKTKDNIENLIALCRNCHVYAHSNNNPQHRDKLKNLQADLIGNK